MKILSHLDADGRRQLALLVSIGGGQMIAAVAVMNGVRQLFDSLGNASAAQSTNPEQGLTLFLMGGGIIMLAGLRALERVVAERFGQRYIAALRLKLFAQLCRLPTQTVKNLSKGSLLMRFTGDLNALRTWIAQGIARLLVTGTFTLAMLLWLAHINLAIAGVTALLITTGLAISWRLGMKLRQRVQTARNKRANLTSNIAEKSTALPVVQVFAQQRREEKRVQRQSDALVDAMVSRAIIIGQLRGVNELTIGVILLALLFIGGAEIRAERLTPGELVASLGLLVMLTPSLRGLGRINEYWHAAKVSFKKINQFMMQRCQDDGARRIAGPLRRHGAVVKFKRVAFHSRLATISATIEAGEKLTVIGPNGAGKSTLLQLLVRLIDPSRGRIQIAGRSIEQLDIKRLRREISMVSPDLPLLRGTIRRNLRYRKGTTDENELERVIRLCELEPLINSLPGGLDSRLAERGSNLSPGERQRLALARALLGNPSILLLDEPEQNTDPATRTLIHRIVQEFEGTLVLVTHDPSLAKLTDRVWYMENGSVVEQGTTAQLLNSDSRSAAFFSPRKSA